MKWKPKYMRVVKRFALFPVKAQVDSLNYEYRWLETVYLDQHRDWLFGVFPIWRSDKFVSKTAYEICNFVRKVDKNDD